MVVIIAEFSYNTFGQRKGCDAIAVGSLIISLLYITNNW